MKLSTILALSLAVVTAAQAGNVTILDSSLTHLGYVQTPGRLIEQELRIDGFAPATYNPASVLLLETQSSVAYQDAGTGVWDPVGDGNGFSGFSFAYASTFTNGAEQEAISAMFATHSVTFSLATESYVDFTQRAYTDAASRGIGYSFTGAGVFAGTGLFRIVEDAKEPELLSIHGWEGSQTTSTTLPAGTYMWLTEASSFAYSYGSYASVQAYSVASYDFRAVPVPEPASMAVLGLGLAGLRRRRARARG